MRLMAGAVALAIVTSACGPRGPVADRLLSGDAALAAVYQRHHHRMLWFQGRTLNARGRMVADMLASAGGDGLDPKAYVPAGLDSGAAADPASVDVALSRGLLAYAADLRRPTGPTHAVFTDPTLQPTTIKPSVVLEQAAFGKAPQALLATLYRVNPIYDGLRAALAQHRRQPSTPEAQRIERLILINMDRARDLPQNFGPRYVWVDIPAARLTAVEGGAPQVSMPVVVGKTEMPTPMMVGVLRYAVINPYWNIPEDLIRDSIAPKALEAGASYLKAENLEVLSDWSETARPLAFRDVDWDAVARGAASVRVRQKPGPNNMMGAMKLMSPNAMGIYLHDTPHRDLFAKAGRTFSSGCVRLQDAPALSRWLFGAEVRSSAARPETRIDLGRPTPLYLAYFTVLPKPGGGVEFREDIYGLDEAALGRSA